MYKLKLINKLFTGESVLNNPLKLLTSFNKNNITFIRQKDNDRI